MDEFSIGDPLYWRRMPFCQFLAMQRLALTRAVNRRMSQGG